MDSMKKKIAYLLLLLMLIPIGSFAKEKRTFEIKDGHFYVNGKVTPILSGEMHYPRIPHQYWRHRLRMMRAMGLNTVPGRYPLKSGLRSAVVWEGLPVPVQSVCC